MDTVAVELELRMSQIRYTNLRMIIIEAPGVISKITNFSVTNSEFRARAFIGSWNWPTIIYLGHY